MHIHIPDDILKQLGYTPRRLLLELSVMLYRDARLPLSGAARLAGHDEPSFKKQLLERQIPLRLSSQQITQNRKRRQDILLRAAQQEDRWRKVREWDVAAWIQEDRDR